MSRQTEPLTKGMYDRPTLSNRFGLRLGQTRLGPEFRTGRKSDESVHNGGWYNKHGEFLGWGSLSAEDIQKIHDELPQGEFFVVVPEQKCSGNPDFDIDTLVANAGWVIGLRQLYYIRDQIAPCEWEGMYMECPDRTKIKEMLTA